MSIDDLDDDVLGRIVSHLPDASLWAAGSVCKSWRRVAACQRVACFVGGCCGRDAELWKYRYVGLLRWLEYQNPPLQPQTRSQEGDGDDADDYDEFVVDKESGAYAVDRLLKELSSIDSGTDVISWRERYKQAISEFRLDAGPGPDRIYRQLWRMCESCGKWMPRDLVYSAWLGAGGGAFPFDAEGPDVRDLFWEWQDFGERWFDHHVVLRKDESVPVRLCIACIEAAAKVASKELARQTLGQVREWWQGEVQISFQGDGALNYDGDREQTERSADRRLVVRSVDDLLAFVLFAFSDTKHRKWDHKRLAFDGIAIGLCRAGSGDPADGLHCSGMWENNAVELVKSDRYGTAWKPPVKVRYLSLKWLNEEGRDVALLGGYLLDELLAASVSKDRVRCENLMGQLFNWVLVRCARENHEEYLRTKCTLLD